MSKWNVFRIVGITCMQWWNHANYVTVCGHTTLWDTSMIEYVYYLSNSYVLFCMVHSSVFLAELEIHVHHCLIKCGGVLHQQIKKKNGIVSKPVRWLYQSSYVVVMVTDSFHAQTNLTSAVALPASVPWCWAWKQHCNWVYKPEKSLSLKENLVAQHFDQYGR